MQKIDKSKCKIRLLALSKYIKLGISSIPKTGRVNQRRVNGIETGASRSILTSTLFPDLEREDISITSQEEILLSRLKMVDQAKNGTSINLQEPSEVDQ